MLLFVDPSMPPLIGSASVTRDLCASPPLRAACCDAWRAGDAMPVAYESLVHLEVTGRRNFCRVRREQMQMPPIRMRIMDTMPTV